MKNLTNNINNMNEVNQTPTENDNFILIVIGIAILLLLVALLMWALSSNKETVSLDHLLPFLES